MLISVSNYADFKAIVATLPQTGSIFYTPSVLPSGLYGVWSHFKDQDFAVQCLTSSNPTSVPTDFPSAISVNSQLTFS